MLDPLSISIPLATPTPTLTGPALPQRKLLRPSPSHPDDYILEIDNTSLERFTTCPRSAENYLVRSREAAHSSSATDFGKLFHSCEELRLLHGLSVDVIQRQRELVAEHFLYHPVAPDDHRTASRMLSVLDTYNERYTNDGWAEKVLIHEGSKMVERAFKVELTTIPINAQLPYEREQLVDMKGHAGRWLMHDVRYERYGTNIPPSLPGGTPVRNLHILWTGRIDVVLHESNALWVVDHKTTSIGGETYYEDFRLSNQTVGYTWAAQRLLNAEVMGLILNAIIVRRPTKTGTGTEFDRRSFFYTQDRIAEWEENVKHLVGDFVGNLCRGYFPQHTKWCMGKYGKCSYHENCSLPRENRAADLATDIFRDVTWNPIH